MLTENKNISDSNGPFEVAEKDGINYGLSFPGLLENLPLGVYRTRIEGDVIYVNKGFLDIFGFASESELHHASIWKLFVNESERGEIIEKCLHNKEYSFEFQVYRKDKSIIWVKDSFRLVPDANGNPVFLDGIIENITDRRLNELKLIESEKRLKESNLSKDKFFSIISHDLRSPLSQIIGATEHLISKLEDYDKKMIHKFLSLLNAEAVQSFRLMENLLQWSKSQRGLIHFEPKPIHVFSLVNQTISFLEMVAAKKQISVDVQVSRDLYLYADKDMLSTILRNLLSNAIKFTDEMGEIIITAVERMDTDLYQTYVEFCVSDNGTGIDPENSSKLFSLTESYNAKGTYNESGTGLGLILCKDFVEKHNGKIWVESEPGAGSDFKFTIY